jgi:hypothetical protein
VKLIRKALFVDGLEQPRASEPVDLDGETDHLFRQSFRDEQSGELQGVALAVDSMERLKKASTGLGRFPI